MPCKAIPQWVEVEVSVALGLVRGMQAKAEIESKDKELQVVAYAESGVQGKLFGKPVEPELSAWSLGSFLMSQMLPASAKMAP